jgi:prepilin-type N-terminal cleavage/methylation domain-containing protein
MNIKNKNIRTKNVKINGYRRRCAGLSLVEILIALSIAALLLGATAMAFDAALDSYKANHDMAMASMGVRNSLYQMSSLIRSAWNDPDYDIIDVSIDGKEIAFVDASGRDIIYQYDETDRQLKVNIDGGAAWYVMLDHVFPITDGDLIFTATDPEFGSFPVGTVGCVEIRFKRIEGDSTRGVSAAVVPRNIVYSD